MMEFAIDHIGYVTKNIEKTAESFGILGYSAEEVVNDDTQKTKICFLRKKGVVSIELVEPYPENATMLNMLKKTTPLKRFSLPISRNDKNSGVNVLNKNRNEKSSIREKLLSKGYQSRRKEHRYHFKRALLRVIL